VTKCRSQAMSCLNCELHGLLEASQSPDPELVDLIESAFLDGQIDGQTADLAYAGLMANRPELAQSATHSATQRTKGYT
jgi:hypothetical protein